MPPVTAEYFTKYRVIWLLQTLQKQQKNTQYICFWYGKGVATAENVSNLHNCMTDDADLWFFVEAGKIPTNNHLHTCEWIFFQHSPI